MNRWDENDGDLEAFRGFVVTVKEKGKNIDRKNYVQTDQKLRTKREALFFPREKRKY